MTNTLQGVVVGGGSGGSGKELPVFVLDGDEEFETFKNPIFFPRAHIGLDFPPPPTWI